MTRLPVAAGATLLAGSLLVSPVAADEVERLGAIPREHEVKAAPVFSPDAKRVAYAAVVGGQSIVVVDGKPGAPSTFADSPVFSDDGAHVAYRAGNRTGRRAEKWWIVVDDETGKSHSWVGPPSITDDGSAVAYWAANGVTLARGTGIYTGGDYFVVFGRKRGKRFSGEGDVLTPPTISPCGKRVGYVAVKSRGAWQVVVDRKASKSFPMVGGPGFSRDGKRWAFPAMLGNGWALVNHRGKVGPRYDSVGTPSFGRASRVAHGACESGSWFAVVGGKRRSGDYAFVGGFVFDAAGDRLAYRANVGGTRGGPALPPGMPPEALPMIPGMGPGVEGGRWWIVVDDERVGDGHDEVGDPVFGPDGRRVAYRARDGEAWRVWCGGRSSDAYDHVSAPVFIDDGQALAFGARRGAELLRVTVGLERTGK